MSDNPDSLLPPLQKLYERYCQFRDNGVFKLRRKTTMEGDTEYEFNFSNYAYYYDYPPNLLNFQSPEVQKDFAAEVIAFCQEDFTKHSQAGPDEHHHQRFKNLLWERNNYKDTKQEMYCHFSKQLGLCRDRELFLLKAQQRLVRCTDQGSLLKKVIEAQQRRNQTEQRSYLNKLVRLSEAIEQHRLGKETSKRVFPAPNEQGKSKYFATDEEISASGFDKTDFVCWARSKHRQQRVTLHLQLLKSQLQQLQQTHLAEIQQTRQDLLRQEIESRLKQQNQIYEHVINTLRAKLTQQRREFLQDQQNMERLRSFCRSVTPMRTSTLKQFPSLEQSYESPTWIPFLEFQFSELARKACLMHLSCSLVDNTTDMDLYIIKMNNYVSIEYRQIKECMRRLIPEPSEPSVEKNDDEDLERIIQGQLQSIFQSEVTNKLIPTPVRKIRSMQLSNITWDSLFRYTLRLEPRQQVTKDLLENQLYFDPILKTLFNLLDSSEEMFRRFVKDYCVRIEQLHEQRLLAVKRSIHYRSVGDQQKILEVVMRHLDRLKQPNEGQNWEAFFNDRIDTSFNRSLLQASYNLIFVGALRLRLKLLNILNAQNCIEKSFVARLRRLSRSYLPYQFTQAFAMKFSNFTEDETHGYQQKHKNDEQINNHIDDDDQLVEMEGDGHPDNLPDIYVRCRNRHDSEFCHGNFIMYPKTFCDFKQLTDRLQRTGSFFVEKHQNNLPQCNLSEMTDRFVMMHELMTGEVNYQRAKLQLMREYYRIACYTVGREAVHTLAQKVFELKHQDYFVDPKKEYFGQCYRLATAKLQQHLQLLKELGRLAVRIETEDNRQFGSRATTHNLSNEHPELALNHYFIESNLARLSESSAAPDRRSIASSVMDDKPTVYVPKHESTLYEINNYLLKNNIVDILGGYEDSENVIISGGKRDELIGFHSRPYLNDSVLGGPFWLQDDVGVLELTGSKEFSYLHQITQLVDIVEEMSGDLASKVALHQQAAHIVRRYRPVLNLQPLRENLLSNYLDLASKDLSNLESNIDSYRFNGLALNFNQELFEAIKAKANPNLIGYRGLYLCINFTQAVRLSHQFTRDRHLIVKTVEQLGVLIGEYGAGCKDLLPYFQKYVGERSGCEEDGHMPYSLSPEHSYQMLFAENLRAFRSVVVYEHCLAQFLKQLVLQLQRKVNLHILAQAQAELLLKHKLAYECDIQTAIDVLQLQGKLVQLRKSKHTLLQKQDISELVQIKDIVTKEVGQKRVLPSNIDSLIEQKVLLNKKLVEVNKISFCLFKLGRTLRYDGYLLQLRSKIVAASRVIPLLASQIVVLPLKRISIVSKQSPPGGSLNRLVFPDSVGLSSEQATSINQRFFPYESLVEAEEQSQSEYQSSRLRVRRLLRELTSESYCTNLRQRDTKLSQVESQYELWRLILEYSECWLMEMSLTCKASDYLELRRAILFEKSLAPTPSESAVLALSRQNILGLRRNHENNPLFVEAEKEYEQQQHIKKTYRDCSKDLKDFCEQCLKAQHQKTPESLELLSAQVRLKQKTLYVVLRDFKHQAPETASALAELYYHSNSALNLHFHELSQEKTDTHLLEYDLTCYDRLEKKSFTFDQYRQFARVFRESPVSLPTYIQRNYFGWRSSHQQQPLLQRLRVLGRVPQQHRNHMSQKLSELYLLASMYNIIKSSNNRQMEVIELYYQNSRVKDLCGIFGLQLNLSEISGKELSRYEALIGNKTIKLNKLQAAALEYSKTVENAKYYQSILNRMTRIIVQTKIHEMDFHRHRYQRAHQDLGKELELLNYNEMDRQRQLQQREIKVRKQLAHGVIVPKIKINAFLSSPLNVDRYFLPHTSKLAYVQAFLNRLRNKVLQVELIDEQFGFLIKTKDLQDCVAFLCKSFIGFSQKQFETRTRSLTQHIEMLENEVVAGRKQLKLERHRNSLLANKAELMVNGLVVRQTSSIMMEFLSMKGRWNEMLDLFQGMESKEHQQAHRKFLGVVDVAECEKKIANDSYVRFRELLSAMTKKDIEWNKLLLERTLRSSIDRILDKPVDSNEQEPPPERNVTIEAEQRLATEQQEYRTNRYTQGQLYLQQLKKQKYFFLLKIQSMQGRHHRQLGYFHQQMRLKDKLQNSYLLEKRKSQQLLEELTSIHNKLKKSDSLVAELHEKLEAQEHTIYRLNREIGALQLKVTANEKADSQKSKTPTAADITKREIWETDAAVQTQYPAFPELRLPKVKHSLDYSKPRSVDFKQTTANEFAIWREKCDSIQTKYQQLRERIAQLPRLGHECQQNNNHFQPLLKEIRVLAEGEHQNLSLQFGDVVVSLKKPNQQHLKHRRLKTMWSEQSGSNY